jgi:hypothetical protein
MNELKKQDSKINDQLFQFIFRGLNPFLKDQLAERELLNRFNTLIATEQDRQRMAAMSAAYPPGNFFDPELKKAHKSMQGHTKAHKDTQKYAKAHKSTQRHTKVCKSV